MVDVKSLRPGDKLRVVSKAPCNFVAWNPKMEKWLGEVVTVYRVTKAGSVLIEEDKYECAFHQEVDGRWYWPCSFFDEVVSESEPPVPATKTELGAFLGF